MPTVVAGWSLWVPAHFVNFALVPTQHRVLYANFVSIGGCFLLSRAAAGDYSGKKPSAPPGPRIVPEGGMEVLLDVNVKVD